MILPILNPAETKPVWRNYFFGFMIFLGLAILLLSLGYRQLIQGEYWTEQMAQSSTRIAKLPAPRGKILDRNGKVLVDNRPSYNVALYLDELGVGRSQKKLLKAVRERIYDLSTRMKMPVHVNENVIKIHYDRRGPLPLTVWNDLSPAALAAFEERSPWKPGVDLSIEPVRVYPFGNLASHVLGYVGKPETTSQEQEMNFETGGRKAFYQPSAIGKAGIEATMDRELQGNPGQVVVRFNAAGLKEAKIDHTMPTPGNNVVLSIDQEIQALVEETFIGPITMKDETTFSLRGACVILDPRNGDVLAMTSVPSYNPNLFIPAIKKIDWQVLAQDQDKPLINRAIQGSYHPGSTFKVIGALAGLESGLITPATVFNCDAIFYLGSIPFRCWQEGGHGHVNLRLAITESCNIYFYTLGEKLGGPRLWEMAQAFGLGNKTGIPIDHEDAGIIGTEEWKRKNHPRDGPWRAGDSVNMAIGQGYVNVTPLQMAVVAATYANGGTVYRPRLVLQTDSPEGDSVMEFPPEINHQLNASPENIQFVREAMLNVVQGDGGTGQRAKVDKIKIAAKTGSAQSPIRDSKTGEVIKQTTTWMISFAPFEAPRYAMAMMVEHGDSGGGTCGPYTGAIYKKIFKLEADRLAPKPPTAIVAEAVSEKIAGFEGEVSGELLGTETTPPPPSPEETDSEMEEEEETSPPDSVHAEKVILP